MPRPQKLPAESQLTHRQVKFINFYLETGKKGASAEAAGYAHPQVAATKLLNDENVLDAIIEGIKKRHKSEIVLAHNVMIDLMQNATDAIKYKAADAVLNRAGYLIAQQHTHTHEIVDSRSDQELMESIKALAAELEIKTIEGEVISGD